MLAVISYHELQKREGRCCSESLAEALCQLAWASGSRCPTQPLGPASPQAAHRPLCHSQCGEHRSLLRSTYYVLLCFENITKSLLKYKWNV